MFRIQMINNYNVALIVCIVCSLFKMCPCDAVTSATMFKIEHHQHPANNKNQHLISITSLLISLFSFKMSKILQSAFPPKHNPFVSFSHYLFVSRYLYTILLMCLLLSVNRNLKKERNTSKMNFHSNCYH